MAHWIFPFARLIGPEGLGPLKGGQHVLAAKAHIRTAFQSTGIECAVYPVRLRTAQEKLHETPCLLQRSERLRPDLKWIHLSTSWPDLTWMSHSLVSGPRGLLFFSLQFLFQRVLVIALTSRCVDVRCVSAWAPLCTCRGVLLHIWERLQKVICVF